MNTPLYNQLIQYSGTKYPFHMPGHKFGKFGNMERLKLHLLDATEATGLDNLYEAEGVIEEAMKLMAEFYGAKETIFLTNGSTAGILASILAVCKPGDKLLVARNCHHSVWSALVLAGVEPVYISPSYQEDKGVIGAIEIPTINEALELHNDVKGAIIVSPTYEGIVSDIRAIAKRLHEKNKILIVDEAHGAHLVIGECFPTSSIREGADLVIHSMHKTLPTLTQSALLHICSSRITKEKIISSLKMVQTSSPSYVMMGLMDYMRGYIQEYQLEIRDNYIKPLIKMRKELGKLKYLRLLDEEMNRYDISKIIILTNQSNISGYELASKLENEYHLGVEASQDSLVILMSTVADNKQSLDILKTALLQIDSKLESGEHSTQVYQFIKQACTLGKTPRDVHFNDKKWVNIHKSIGEICAKNIMLYPPGIPIVCIGEIIQPHHLEAIRIIQEKALGIQIDGDQIQLCVVDRD